MYTQFCFQMFLNNSVVNFVILFVILSAILLSIKWPDASAAFWIALFEVVFSAAVADFLAWSKWFLLYFLLNF